MGQHTMCQEIFLSEDPPKAYTWLPLGVGWEYVFHNEKSFPLKLYISYFVVVDLKLIYALLTMNSIIYYNNDCRMWTKTSSKVIIQEREVDHQWTC